MSKISVIDRTSPSQLPMRQSTLTGRRPVAFDTLKRTHLHLVPRATTDAVTTMLPPPTRIARYRWLLLEHPSLVDAGFVTMTLGMAAFLWWCGW